MSKKLTYSRKIIACLLAASMAMPSLSPLLAATTSSRPYKLIEEDLTSPYVVIVKEGTDYVAYRSSVPIYYVFDEKSLVVKEEGVVKRLLYNPLMKTWQQTDIATSSLNEKGIFYVKSQPGVDRQTQQADILDTSFDLYNTNTYDYLDLSDSRLIESPDEFLKRVTAGIPLSVLGLQQGDSSYAITGDLNLASKAVVYGQQLSLSWVSSNTNVISNTGKVVVPLNNTNVMLTATVQAGNNVITKNFNVTVLGYSENEAKTLDRLAKRITFSDLNLSKGDKFSSITEESFVPIKTITESFQTGTGLLNKVYKVYWKSSNEQVVKVDALGAVRVNPTYFGYSNDYIALTAYVVDESVTYSQFIQNFDSIPKASKTLFVRPQLIHLAPPVYSGNLILEETQDEISGYCVTDGVVVSLREILNGNVLSDPIAASTVEDEEWVLRNLDLEANKSYALVAEQGEYSLPFSSEISVIKEVQVPEVLSLSDRLASITSLNGACSTEGAAITLHYADELGQVVSPVDASTAIVKDGVWTVENIKGLKVGDRIVAKSSFHGYERSSYKVITIVETLEKPVYQGDDFIIASEATLSGTGNVNGSEIFAYIEKPIEGAEKELLGKTKVENNKWTIPVNGKVEVGDRITFKATYRGAQETLSERSVTVVETLEEPVVTSSLDIIGSKAYISGTSNVDGSIIRVYKSNDLSNPIDETVSAGGVWSLNVSGKVEFGDTLIIKSSHLANQEKTAKQEITVVETLEAPVYTGYDDILKSHTTLEGTVNVDGATVFAYKNNEEKPFAQAVSKDNKWSINVSKKIADHDNITFKATYKASQEQDCIRSVDVVETLESPHFLTGFLNGDGNREITIKEAIISGWSNVNDSFITLLRDGKEITNKAAQTVNNIWSFDMSGILNIGDTIKIRAQHRANQEKDGSNDLIVYQTLSMPVYTDETDDLFIVKETKSLTGNTGEHALGNVRIELYKEAAAMPFAETISKADGSWEVNIDGKVKVGDIITVKAFYNANQSLEMPEKIQVVQTLESPGLTSSTELTKEKGQINGTCNVDSAIIKVFKVSKDGKEEQVGESTKVSNKTWAIDVSNLVTAGDDLVVKAFFDNNQVQSITSNIHVYPTIQKPVYIGTEHILPSEKQLSGTHNVDGTTIKAYKKGEAEAFSEATVKDGKWVIALAENFVGDEIVIEATYFADQQMICDTEVKVVGVLDAPLIKSNTDIIKEKGVVFGTANRNGAKIEIFNTKDPSITLAETIVENNQWEVLIDNGKLEVGDELKVRATYVPSQETISEQSITVVKTLTNISYSGEPYIFKSQNTLSGTVNIPGATISAYKKGSEKPFATSIADESGNWTVNISNATFVNDKIEFKASYRADQEITASEIVEVVNVLNKPIITSTTEVLKSNAIISGICQTDDAIIQIFKKGDLNTPIGETVVVKKSFFVDVSDKVSGGDILVVKAFHKGNQQSQATSTVKVVSDGLEIQLTSSPYLIATNAIIEGLTNLDDVTITAKYIEDEYDEEGTFLQATDAYERKWFMDVTDDIDGLPMDTEILLTGEHSDYQTVFYDHLLKIIPEIEMPKLIGNTKITPDTTSLSLDGGTQGATVTIHRVEQNRSLSDALGSSNLTGGLTPLKIKGLLEENTQYKLKLSYKGHTFELDQVIDVLEKERSFNLDTFILDIDSNKISGKVLKGDSTIGLYQLVSYGSDNVKTFKKSVISEADGSFSIENVSDALNTGDKFQLGYILDGQPVFSDIIYATRIKDNNCVQITQSFVEDTVESLMGTHTVDGVKVELLSEQKQVLNSTTVKNNLWKIDKVKLSSGGTYYLSIDGQLSEPFYAAAQRQPLQLLNDDASLLAAPIDPDLAYTPQMIADSLSKHYLDDSHLKTSGFAPLDKISSQFILSDKLLGFEDNLDVSIRWTFPEKLPEGWAAGPHANGTLVTPKRSQETQEIVISAKVVYKGIVSKEEKRFTITVIPETSAAEPVDVQIMTQFLNDTTKTLQIFETDASKKDIVDVVYLDDLKNPTEVKNTTYTLTSDEDIDFDLAGITIDNAGNLTVDRAKLIQYRDSKGKNMKQFNIEIETPLGLKVVTVNLEIEVIPSKKEGELIFGETFVPQVLVLGKYEPIDIQNTKRYRTLVNYGEYQLMYFTNLRPYVTTFNNEINPDDENNGKAALAFKSSLALDIDIYKATADGWPLTSSQTGATAEETFIMLGENVNNVELVNYDLLNSNNVTELPANKNANAQVPSFKNIYLPQVPISNTYMYILGRGVSDYFFISSKDPIEVVDGKVTYPKEYTVYTLVASKWVKGTQETVNLNKYVAINETSLNNLLKYSNTDVGTFKANWDAMKNGNPNYISYSLEFSVPGDYIIIDSYSFGVRTISYSGTVDINDSILHFSNPDSVKEYVLIDNKWIEGSDERSAYITNNYYSRIDAVSSIRYSNKDIYSNGQLVVKGLDSSLVDFYKIVTSATLNIPAPPDKTGYNELTIKSGDTYINYYTKENLYSTAQDDIVINKYHTINDQTTYYTREYVSGSWSSEVKHELIFEEEGDTLKTLIPDGVKDAIWTSTSIKNAEEIERVVLLGEPKDQAFGQESFFLALDQNNKVNQFYPNYIYDKAYLDNYYLLNLNQGLTLAETELVTLTLTSTVLSVPNFGVWRAVLYGKYEPINTVGKIRSLLSYETNITFNSIPKIPDKSAPEIKYAYLLKGSLYVYIEEFVPALPENPNDPEEYVSGLTNAPRGFRFLEDVTLPYDINGLLDGFEDDGAQTITAGTLIKAGTTIWKTEPLLKLDLKNQAMEIELLAKDKAGNISTHKLSLPKGKDNEILFGEVEQDIKDEIQEEIDRPEDDTDAPQFDAIYMYKGKIYVIGEDRSVEGRPAGGLHFYGYGFEFVDGKEVLVNEAGEVQVDGYGQPILGTYYYEDIKGFDENGDQVEAIEVTINNVRKYFIKNGYRPYVSKDRISMSKDAATNKYIDSFINFYLRDKSENTAILEQTLEITNKSNNTILWKRDGYELSSSIIKMLDAAKKEEDDALAKVDLTPPYIESIYTYNGILYVQARDNEKLNDYAYGFDWVQDSVAKQDLIGVTSADVPLTIKEGSSLTHGKEIFLSTGVLSIYIPTVIDITARDAAGNEVTTRAFITSNNQVVEGTVSDSIKDAIDKANKDEQETEDKEDTIPPVITAVYVQNGRLYVEGYDAGSGLADIPFGFNPLEDMIIKTDYSGISPKGSNVLVRAGNIVQSGTHIYKSRNYQEVMIPMLFEVTLIDRAGNVASATYLINKDDYIYAGTPGEGGNGSNNGGNDSDSDNGNGDGGNGDGGNGDGGNGDGGNGDGGNGDGGNGDGGNGDGGNGNGDGGNNNGGNGNGDGGNNNGDGGNNNGGNGNGDGGNNNGDGGNNNGGNGNGDGGNGDGGNGDGGNNDGGNNDGGNNGQTDGDTPIITPNQDGSTILVPDSDFGNIDWSLYDYVVKVFEENTNRLVYTIRLDEAENVLIPRLADSTRYDVIQSAVSEIDNSTFKTKKFKWMTSDKTGPIITKIYTQGNTLYVEAYDQTGLSDQPYTFTLENVSNQPYGGPTSNNYVKVMPQDTVTITVSDKNGNETIKQVNPTQGVIVSNINYKNPLVYDYGSTISITQFISDVKKIYSISDYVIVPNDNINFTSKDITFVGEDTFVVTLVTANGQIDVTISISNAGYSHRTAVVQQTSDTNFVLLFKDKLMSEFGTINGINWSVDGKVLERVDNMFSAESVGICKIDASFNGKTVPFYVASISKIEEAVSSYNFDSNIMPYTFKIGDSATLDKLFNISGAQVKEISNYVVLETLSGGVKQSGKTLSFTEKGRKTITLLDIFNDRLKTFEFEVASLQPWVANFKDIADSNDRVAIEYLTQKGVIEPISDMHFKPNNHMTVKEYIATINKLMLLYGEKVTAKQEKTIDLAKRDFDYFHVMNAFIAQPEEAIKPIMGDTTYNSAITRAQAVQLLSLLIPQEHSMTNAVIFKDVINGSNTDVAIRHLSSLNMIDTSKDTFRPEDKITKGEFATYLYKYLNYLL